MAENTPQGINESLKRFSKILTELEIHQIHSIQQTPLPIGVRINPLKSNPQAAIQALAARYGWETKPVPFCENAWTIERASFPPGRTIEHRMGQFYLQDAASMVPVCLLDFPEPHPLILDMAASPGGKTTHLIDRTLDQGFILANDASQSRIPALRSVLSNWGGINIAVTNFPGELLGDWFPDTFDVILLDAPCSMENLRPTPSHPLRETTPSERLRLQSRQEQLLRSGLKTLKIGGHLVYATCSLAPEENEAVIDKTIKSFPGTFVIEDVTDKHSIFSPGLTAFTSQNYDPSLIHSLRLWPHLTGMSGFFCARLKKISQIPSLPETSPSRDFSLTHLEPATPHQQNQILEQISTNYGFDMGKILIEHQLALFTRHEKVFLIPTIYLDNFLTLPFEYIGMQVGDWIEESLQPSHEFISRFGKDFTRGIIQIDKSQVDQWISGRDIRHPQTNLTPQGQYLLVVDSAERNLGIGKLLPKRLRNMLPRGLI